MMFASCASLPAGQWVKTSDGVSLWSSSLDTLSNYSWPGNSFDSIANGKGTVTKFGSDGSSNSYTSNIIQASFGFVKGKAEKIVRSFEVFFQFYC